MSEIEWRIPVSEDERGDIVSKVTDRVVAELMDSVSKSPENELEYIINDVLYHEKQRARSEGYSSEMKEELSFLKSATRGLSSSDDEKKELMLRKLVQHYAEDIAGHFDKKVYAFTTKILPIGLEAIFNVQSPDTLLSGFSHMPDLRARIAIRGNIDHVKEMARKGTIIVTPTHSSNMDSVVVGWAMNEAGLPPLNYGAGKNLFTNYLLSFFMNSLGAYKVDRRIKHSLYKDTLKYYSIVILEHGCHSLFFPGGTRSRSGTVEKKLKLGLLGTGLKAFINNLLAGKENPNIYVVPLTINYPIVLEGETLIDDYLKEAGKSRYIIEDDEFSKPFKTFKFASNLMKMESSMTLHFGEPMDLFGNIVDENGVSLDPRGRQVDVRGYVTNGAGEIVHDDARDAEYTKELGEAIKESFHRNTVVLSTHALAFTLFNMLRCDNPGSDLYRMLRFEGEGKKYPIKTVLPRLAALTDELLKLNNENKIKLGGPIRPGDCAQEVMYDALRFFSMYHTKPVVSRRSENIILTDLNLLYYYHNRLVGWGLEKCVSGRN